ncbi:hypothetical protein [Pandoraea sputorum]
MSPYEPRPEGLNTQPAPPSVVETLKPATMKMARASEADLDAAQKVASIIEELHKGYMPATDDDDDFTWFDRDDPEQCQKVLGALLDATEKTSLFRVTFGMAVILDPRNKLLDPNADTLEMHPELKAALGSKENQNA